MKPSSAHRLSLLLLPGMDGDGRLFNRLRAALESKLGLCVDVVSYNDLAISSYDDIEADVRSQLAGLGPVVLVGESFSGPVVVRLCAAPPSNLVAGVVVSSFPYSPVPAPHWLSPVLSRLILYFRPPRWALRLALVGRGADEDLVDEVQSVISGTSKQLLSSRLRAIMQVDVRAALADCRLPMLGIRASKDRLVSRSVNRQLSRSCAGMAEVELDGPHLLAQVNPMGVAHEIEVFLRSLEVETSGVAGPRGI